MNKKIYFIIVFSYFFSALFGHTSPNIILGIQLQFDLDNSSSALFPIDAPEIFEPSELNQFHRSHFTRDGFRFFTELSNVSHASFVAGITFYNYDNSFQSNNELIETISSFFSFDSGIRLYPSSSNFGPYVEVGTQLSQVRNIRYWINDNLNYETDIPFTSLVWMLSAGFKIPIVIDNIIFEITTRYIPSDNNLLFSQGSDLLFSLGIAIGFHRVNWRSFRIE